MPGIGSHREVQQAREKKFAPTSAPSRRKFPSSPESKHSNRREIPASTLLPSFLPAFLPSFLLTLLAVKTGAPRRFDSAHRQKPQLLARGGKKAVQHPSIYLSIYLPTHPSVHLSLPRIFASVSLVISDRGQSGSSSYVSFAASPAG